MGYSLQLQLVYKIDNPEIHQFAFPTPKSEWDYVDRDNEYWAIRIINQFSDTYETWKEAEFLSKTDGRCYQGDEGYESTIYLADEVLEFIYRFENEIKNSIPIHEYQQSYFIPNKNGKIEFNEELKGIKQLCETARAKGYFLKCLDR